MLAKLSVFSRSRWAAVGVAAVLGGTVLWRGAWAQQAPVPSAPPANETLEQKVARLERETSELRGEIARLRSELQQKQDVVPPGATAIPFNGRTYYYLPLNLNNDKSAEKPEQTVAKPNR